eukprot:GHVT01065103.1.p1 GENE.GHVT01065103.1~~GHVT01065103.1.p1  ORF type:complete len:334 (-),score=30.06 GHVT01065103.1:1480-2481(-)
MPVPCAPQSSAGQDEVKETVATYNLRANYDYFELQLQDTGRQLEELLVKEPGNRNLPERGAKELYVDRIQGNLANAAKAITSPECKKVMLLVGSTNNMLHWPPTDTDGPGGACALARTLMKLNKEVVIVSDEVNHDQVFPALKSSEAWKIKTELPEMESQLTYMKFPAAKDWTDEAEDQLLVLFESVNHIINVGRPGPGENGTYWSYDCRQMTQYQPDFTKLFTWAEYTKGQRNPPMLITAIGTIGSELGMGPLRFATEKWVPNGRKLACSIASDFPIVATVVDWGAYALCAMLGLYGIARTPLENTNHMMDVFVPKTEDQDIIMKILVKEGM